MTPSYLQNLLWVEKYRPKRVQDCVLPTGIKTTFQDMVDKGEVQNLLLSGTAGTGKTTIAKALCDELGCDYILINCSEDGNIDTLRTRIRNFASTVSLGGGRKVVILDEFDYSNSQSTQPALRGFIEEFAANCRFILTCNFKNRIIEPLHSRCTTVEFSIPQKEKPRLASEFMERVRWILGQEGVKFDEKVVAELIMRHFPDFRKTLNELQRYSVGGEIDVGILQGMGEIPTKELVGHMKEKNFNEVRKWVVHHAENDQTRIFRQMYDSLYTYFKPESIPQAVLIINDYQDKATRVADPEINLTAFLVHLMMECEFK